MTREFDMRRLLHKLFGGLNMTWPMVIIFAVAAGIYTALMALLVPASCSFHDIAVTEEAWIPLALIIMLNCKGPLESALKTFVFFLISQPLVYLIQIPFHDMGWDLFGYYRYWFYITLGTFPAAFIGWYVKKNNLLAALILSPMLVLLVFHGVGYVITLRNEFPHHLISAIYCFVMIPILVFGIFSNWKPILLSFALSIATFVGLFIYKWSGSGWELLTVNVLLATEEFDLKPDWSASVEDESFATAEIVSYGDGETQVIVHYKKAGTGVLVLTDGAGNTHRIQLTIDEEKITDEKLID